MREFKECPGLRYANNFITDKEAHNALMLIDSLPWNMKLSRRTQHYGCEYVYAGKTPHYDEEPLTESKSETKTESLSSLSSSKTSILIYNNRPVPVDPRQYDANAFDSNVMSQDLKHQ